MQNRLNFVGSDVFLSFPRFSSIGVLVSEEDMHLCGLWESFYPSELHHGLPKKQHIIAFYRVILHQPSSEITLKLQEKVLLWPALPTMIMVITFQIE